MHRFNCTSMKQLSLILCSLSLLTACATSSSDPSASISLGVTSQTPIVIASSSPSTPSPQPSVDTVAKIVLPIDEYGAKKTLKVFGEYIQDRFTGYHVADDIEYTDIESETPVRAMADGQIEIVQFASGYGGMIKIKHKIDNQTIHSIYGHIALDSTQLKAGDQVKAGQFLANLGKNNSEESDGERKHLHFGLYAGDENRINGYESEASAVSKWINPEDFFAQHQVTVGHPTRTFSSSEIGGDNFKLQFTIPADWEVEYIPARKALNLFSLRGEGTARDRSQMYISFFDAKQFLTLTTVNVLSTQDLKVGKEAYTGKRYEIEKKANVASFDEQPGWRNSKHFVTDLRGQEGQTRYYALAKNPRLDEIIYQQVLASIKLE
jgi:hypothetical protein